MRKEGGKTFQSLDYDQICSQLWLREQATLVSDGRKVYGYSGATAGRWLITLSIGLCGGAIAFIMSEAIERILDYKLQLINDDVALGQPWVPLLNFIAYNTALVSVAAVFVIGAPEAASSGIPEVIGYLNGVHIPKFLRLRTLVAKVIGTTLVVASGLSVGPEGPLVHCGAILGSGFTRGVKTFRFCGGRKLCTVRLKLLSMFHNDTDRRDFISIGAAVGFASAFGAPIGGVLFAMEEAASSWHDKLMWRCMTATSLACFTLAALRSSFRMAGLDPEEKSNARFEPGMLTLSSDADLSFTSHWELGLCLIVGALGGILGALFNHWFAKLAKRRPKPTARLKRVLEAILISVISSVVIAGLVWTGGEVKLYGQRERGFSCNCLSATVVNNPAGYSDCIGALDPSNRSGGCAVCYVQDGLTNDSQVDTGGNDHLGWFCDQYTHWIHCNITNRTTRTDDSVIQWDPKVDLHKRRECHVYQNVLATLLVGGRENSILQMMGAANNFDPLSLFITAVAYFGLTLLAFGGGFPAGVFMPTIMIGCSWGALFGQGAQRLSYWAPWFAGGIVRASPYSLMGAVAMLGGVQRSSLSLVVIIVEGTGKIDYLLPIILTTVISKWLGDQLNEGLYHTALHLKGIPFLESSPSRSMMLQTAADIMGHGVVTFARTESVGAVLDALSQCDHHGFPVVHANEYGDMVLHGLVLRVQLTVLISKRHFRFQKQLSAGTSSADMDTPADSISLRQSLVEAIGDLTHRSKVEQEMKAINNGLSEGDREMVLDLAEVMNPAPVSVQQNCPLHRVHSLVRSCGLRHLAVTNDSGRVVGIITRSDLIRAFDHRSDHGSDHGPRVAVAPEPESTIYDMS
jgi:chloride channel 7